MREQFDEVKKLRKCAAVDLHRHMLAVEYDAVLIVINIRRVLESPFISLDGDRDDPVVLTGRVIDAAGVSFILHAQLAFRIGRGFGSACGCDRLRIFLRLGQVDRDIQRAVLGFHGPLPVPCDAVAADIVAVLAEFVIISSGVFRRFLIFFPEYILDLRRTGHEAVHQLRVEEITVGYTVFDDPAFHGFVEKIF